MQLLRSFILHDGRTLVGERATHPRLKTVCDARTTVAQQTLAEQSAPARSGIRAAGGYGRSSCGKG
jgi:hypothetical protein